MNVIKKTFTMKKGGVTKETTNIPTSNNHISKQFYNIERQTITSINDLSKERISNESKRALIKLGIKQPNRNRGGNQ